MQPNHRHRAKINIPPRHRWSQNALAAKAIRRVERARESIAALEREVIEWEQSQRAHHSPSATE